MRMTLALAVAAHVAAAGFGLSAVAAGGSTQSTQTRTEPLQSVRNVPRRVVAAWARNDADAFARVWAADGDFVVADGTRLVGRRAIRAYMTRGFAGPLKGARAKATVTRVRLLSLTVGLVQTTGGILMPGETRVPTERLGIQTWVVTKHGREWLVSTYQNTRIDQR